MKKMRTLFVYGLCIFAALGLAACSSVNLSYDSYDLDEYIEVGDYKGLETAGYTISVTEEEVDAQIQSELQAAATTEKLADASEIAAGDTVNIDYVGKIDGKKFDGGSAEGYELTIGSGAFIDGFETGLIGKKVGEKTTLALTFPADYQQEDLQGKDVEFTVTINSATRETLPEYGLDYVQNTTDYDTIEAYEEAVKERLYANKESEAVTTQQTELWSKALDNTEVKKYPEKELEYYIQFNSDQMDEMAKAYGMSREDLLASYNFGDEEEFSAVNEDSSKLRVKQEMLIEYIADKEGLEYTKKEKNKLIKEFEATGYDDESIEQQTGRDMDDYVRIELLYQKVLDFLLENANITEATAAEAEAE